jgi:5-formyltetrahydrofolate cyclo-ligase
MRVGTPAAAAAAQARLLGLPELERARTVAVYSAIGDEVPLEPVAEACRARAVHVVYPVVVGAELELAPDPARAARVPAGEVDLFVVPALRFDRAGRRLGRGGGHYDRLLKRRRADAWLVGICYDDRVIDELPEDPWDVRMHVVVTDRAVLRFAEPGRR